MNSNTYNHDQSSPPQIISQTIQHQQHAPQYKCLHRNKTDEKTQQISNLQTNTITDYPYVLLNNQHVRDMTDVYRREKDFLKQQYIVNDTQENLRNEIKESKSKYYLKEYSYNIPCNCESSLAAKICQRFINGIKIGAEFFLFMTYIIGRRNELLEDHYPFDRYQSYNSHVKHQYPFVRRSTYSNEMEKLNTIRNQLNKKRLPIKHTMTNTYYDIH
ncbi:unnamed protein product [Adineta steineri]|uniref:Uncharacterized protein n=1 Tax=Adineta steineri TaxID=433720 RepID=A0A818TUG1_9BILA|nr:unnamed protein product [Adineta steineri]CAF3684041.1 unnamed protein product [Adineta steineri]